MDGLALSCPYYEKEDTGSLFQKVPELLSFPCSIQTRLGVGAMLSCDISPHSSKEQTFNVHRRKEVDTNDCLLWSESGELPWRASLGVGSVTHLILLGHITDALKDCLSRKYSASCPGPTFSLRAKEAAFHRVTQDDSFSIIQTPYGLAGPRKNRLFLARK